MTAYTGLENCSIAELIGRADEANTPLLQEFANRVAYVWEDLGRPFCITGELSDILMANTKMSERLDELTENGVEVATLALKEELANAKTKIQLEQDSVKVLTQKVTDARCANAELLKDIEALKRAANDIPSGVWSNKSQVTCKT